jgi:hypothetical protein
MSGSSSLNMGVNALSAALRALGPPANVSRLPRTPATLTPIFAGTQNVHGAFDA